MTPRSLYGLALVAAVCALVLMLRGCTLILGL